MARGEGRALITLLLAMGAVNALLSFLNVSMLAVATDVGGAALAGVAIALGGVAMIGGGLAAGRVGVATRPVRVFAIGLAVMALGCAVAASRPWFPFVAIGVVVALVPVSLVNAGVATCSTPGAGGDARSGVRRAEHDGPLARLDGAVLAGVVIAEVAAPAMREGGGGASMLGRLVGRGLSGGRSGALGHRALPGGGWGGDRWEPAASIARRSSDGGFDGSRRRRRAAAGRVTLVVAARPESSRDVGSRGGVVPNRHATVGRVAASSRIVTRRRVAWRRRPESSRHSGSSPRDDSARAALHPPPGVTIRDDAVASSWPP